MQVKLWYFCNSHFLNGVQLKKGTKIYWTVSRIYYFSAILVVQQNQDLQTWFLLWTSFKEKLESWLNSHTRNISQYHPHNTPLTNTFDHLEYWLDSKVDILTFGFELKHCLAWIGNETFGNGKTEYDQLAKDDNWTWQHFSES